LDTAERTLHLDGQVLRLSGTETRLLQYLMQHRDSVVATSAVAKHVWDYDDVPAREVVRVTVHRLRRKIGDSGPERRFIHTIPGVGLKLRVPTEADERRSAL
jgi:DNA-binding response OmpR family regulator